MTKDLLTRRARLLGPNMATFYDDPVHIVRGQGVWLWDADGRRYLDCYNNVPHVGHCHPRVVEAIATQAATLNTHTRYVHEGIVDYAERLVATFSGGLETVIMVCTGSEANDIALRMGQAVTGKTGIIATDNTYHGNTHLVSQLSTRKPPIGGHAPNVIRVPSPDSLRPLGGSAEGQAQVFAGHVAGAIARLEAEGHGFSSLILCPFFANEGFPDLAPGFLDPVANVVKKGGGLLIADEVQPGFGRLGGHFWGHRRIGVQPDVVTMGKPMGNGHPVAAVVARSNVTAAFREAFGYFNTFGGNPVSCAAAMAVMDVLEEEGLVQNARDVGAYALERMRALRHPLIGDVRGAGLFLGMEFVGDELEPQPDFTAHVVEAMKARGILLNRLGRHGNCLKIRPPMPFSRGNADMLVETLAEVLAEMPR
ncbi:MAG: aspartate aminotransferase family protein [Rhodobacteraceae bacterium]|nr:aspartate aminotransferase family protein [Paracoccaceae bacterium]